MRAMHITAPGHFGFVDVPVPAVQPGYALVRPLIESLCGSDVRAVYYAAPEEYPMPIGRGGHEVIAVVQEIGDSDAAQTGLAPGDNVLALVPDDEGMAEYLLIGAENLVSLPEGAPLEHLLMAQQLGTVIYAAKRLPNIVGADVAVIGQGSAGLFLDAVLRRLGAARVIGLDTVPARCAAAFRFGATHVFDCSQVNAVEEVAGLTEGGMCDLVAEAAGEIDTIELMSKLVSNRGTLLAFGIPRGAYRFEYDYWSLFRTHGQLIASSGAMMDPGKQCFRMALDLIARREIDVAPMITHHVPFDRVAEGYELARTREDGAIKVIIEMPQ